MHVPNLDISELCFLYSDNDEFHKHYLNIETGETVFVSEFSMDQDEIDELYEELEDEKYVLVPQITSHEAYEIMEDFAATVEDLETSETLIEALNRRKPFRNFKDALSEYPDEENRWYKFEAEVHRQAILEWLKQNDIQID